MALGCFFPLIGAHKVLAAYGCLIPRLVTGRFDPQLHKAVWPSTGNYCRGGIAISRILGCRGIAVLPERMSEERFDWLRAWTPRPEDIVRTPGSESNVKEIYDKCAELARDPDNVILNQFAEFGNYVAHYTCTGPALAQVFDAAQTMRPRLRLAAFVAASGSAGTLAAGDYLKKVRGARVIAAEASECPTLLRNGFGEHNIQGIGDKHVPYIHNVMNTDIVVGVSDRSTGSLDLLFNSETGLSYLTGRRHIDPELLSGLKLIGLSGIANLVAAIKTAKRLDLGEEDAIVTVATDSAALYGSERCKFLTANYPDGFDTVSAGEVFGQHLLGAADNDVLELTHNERSRIFNLGYYTWVEQQGVPVEALRTAARPRVLGGAAACCTGLGHADRRVQCCRRLGGRFLTLAYTELRRRTGERDRSLREKVMSLEEAAALVPDGASVGIGGSTLSRTPMAMIWALIRAGRKDLVCSRSITSSEGELLFASGASRHILTSWFSQGIVWGVSRVMRLYTEGQRARFEEWSHLAMGLRFRAGAMGVPFLPMRSMMGSDVIETIARHAADRLPVHWREAGAGSGAEPGFRADPRPALRRLWQCADRRPAVHGP